MNAIRPAILLAALLAASASAGAACDFSAIDRRVQDLLAQDGLADGAVLIGTPRGTLFRKFYGSYDASTVIPVASASKLLAGTRILQLADRGALALDTPVSAYLGGTDYPWSAGAAPITLRQMFSHTAGYGNDSGNPDTLNPFITLAQSVQRIASNYNGLAPQNYAPAGTLFAYGGVSMQIGGQVAQQVTGQDWEQSWRSDLGAPLCSSSIDWQGLVGDKTHHTQNYPIAGGAESSLDDYANVLAMLASDGIGNGVRLLSPAAIATLNHSQTGNAALGYAPPAANGSTQYGIGAWIEPSGVSTDLPTISSIGAYGFAPWVDFSNRTFGIVMVYDSATLPAHDPGINSHLAIVDIIAALRAMNADGASCPVLEVRDPVFSDGWELAAPPPACPAMTPP